MDRASENAIAIIPLLLVANVVPLKIEIEIEIFETVQCPFVDGL